MKKRKSHKPKVLFIGPYPPPYSGPEIGMKLFLESSLKDQFHIKFLKTNVRKTNVNKGRFDPRMVFAFFVFMVKLTWALIRFRPKVAYYPVTATKIGWIGRDVWCLLLCHIFRVKTVIHLRGGHLKLNFTNFQPIIQIVVRHTCHQVACALVQAECLREQFEGLVEPKKIKLLYQAIDPREYDNNAINDYDPNLVLFMGHLTQAKGYCDLVKVIPIVSEHFPNVKFCFAGTLRKGERNVLFNQRTGNPLIYEDPFLVYEDLPDNYKVNYRYFGVIFDLEKQKLLKKTNIFLLPSYSEGFSRSLLEAMSMGKPVICTPVGAHKEIITEGVNGYLVEPGDVEMLANKIISLMREPSLRAKIANENYNYVRKCFDINLIAKQMGEHLDHVLKQN